MSKLSVVVPVYNAEKYLKECLDSILKQTFTNLEIILINDGSSDRSGEICDEYALRDERIRVIHQENHGVTFSRQLGTSYATGDFVTYVDSDDWIDKETYSVMMAHIEDTNADIGIFAMLIEDVVPKAIINNTEPGFFSKEKLNECIYNRMLFDYELNGSALIPSLCNKIIKRSILCEVIPSVSQNIDYGEDAIAAYLAILNAASVYVSNDTFYHYRTNLSSASYKSSDVMAQRIVALKKEMKKCFTGTKIDVNSQIDGYITRHTVEWTRDALLDSSDNMSFSERCKVVSSFVDQDVISSSLCLAYPKIQNLKEKIKVFLIRHKQFRLLKLLFKKV